MSRVISSFHSRERWRKFHPGFTLLELIITMGIMTILTLGIMPLVKTSVKRQREERLRHALREIRTAIDEFRRDTAGLQCGATGSGSTSNSLNPDGGATDPASDLTQQQDQLPQGQQLQRRLPIFSILGVDPRSKVMISDCTIFSAENPDYFPPTLESLVNGVSVIPRSLLLAGGLPQTAIPGSSDTSGTEDKGTLIAKKKVYLRSIPLDPMTEKAEWDLRSTYDSSDSTSWGGQNVFDVRSLSSDTALSGEKYSDW
ncbi:MAG: type II secretion system protein [Pyrinomonadaceae bacterium]